MPMNKLLPVAIGFGLLAGTVPAIAATTDAAPGEAELFQLLEGRVAGEPVRCLSTFQRQNMQVVDHTAFVFKDGDTLYVNRPEGANFLTWSDLPAFETWGSDVCEKDRVRLLDRSSGIQGPILVLGNFVPYRRAG